MVITIVVLTVSLITTGYIIWNLMRKVERQEDVIQDQERYIRVISEAIDYSNNRLKEVDEKGVFEADDEIGWFFKNLKELQEALDQYNVLTTYEEKK